MSDILEVFDFWRQCSKHDRARLDDKRGRLIAKAMRWGYPVQDLKLAILGCCSDPWYGGGQNDRRTVYTHLELILRDGDHIDKFYKAGEQEVMRCWSAAIAENERRRPAQPIPEEARRRMLELVKKPRAS